MIAILDTSVFIWLCKEPDKLSERVRKICFDADYELCLSIVSVWEMQIKVMLGKLQFDLAFIEQQKVQNDVNVINVELKHIYGLAKLPSIHSDPFDRMIVSQAREMNALLLSSDSKIAQYPVNVIW